MLIAFTGVAVLVSGCSGGVSQSEVTHAKTVAVAVQAQKDSQAVLSVQVKQLDDVAKAAAAQATADRAAAAKAAADKAAAQPQIAWCPSDPNVGVSGPTSCEFATSVRYTFTAFNTNFTAFSPKTGLSYTMSCTSGDQIVCRGGNNAIVYIRTGSVAQNAPVRRDATGFALDGPLKQLPRRTTIIQARRTASGSGLNCVRGPTTRTLTPLIWVY